LHGVVDDVQASLGVSNKSPACCMAAPSLLGVAERRKEGRVCVKERKAGTGYTYGSMAAVSLTDTLPYGGGTLPGAVKAAAMPNGIAARAATSFLIFMS
jgi:hypothetical protein